MRWRVVCLTVLLFLTSAAFGDRFGTGCQRDFQNNWQTEVAWTWNRCAGFNDQMDDTDTKVFYANLHNGSWWWHNGGDASGLDAVHLFYGNTHGGGTWANDAIWAMWDDGMYARSSLMRLGDHSTNLSIMANYSCETHRFADGRLWARWDSVFAGGLRMSLGSHDKLWDGITTDECGQDFAAELQNGKLIKYAWVDGNSDWATAQDVLVLTVGRDRLDCEARRDNMTWQNHQGWAQLRDSQIGWFCGQYWDDL